MRGQRGTACIFVGERGKLDRPSVALKPLLLVRESRPRQMTLTMNRSARARANRAPARATPILKQLSSTSHHCSPASARTGG